MNVKHLIAALAVLSATGSSFAQEFVTPDAGFVSTLTRAEVVAGISEARANGTLDFSDANYPVVASVGTPRTRAEVHAEITQARAEGTLEVSDATYPVIPAAASAKSRAEVIAELEQYKKSHPNGESIYSSGS